MKTQHLIGIGAFLFAEAAFIYAYFCALIQSRYIAEVDPFGMELMLGVVAGFGALGLALVAMGMVRE